MQTNSDRKIAETILQYAPDMSTLQVLEVGCGDGRISALLAEKSGQFVAIDPDVECIAAAIENISEGEFKVGSGEQLSFAESSFDLVIFTLSLHHQNSSEALTEAARVMKPSGRIMVIEPHVDGEVEKAFAFVHNENQAKVDAQQAIYSSALSLEIEEEFTASWSFADTAELLHSLFDYYQAPFDEVAAEQIMSFVSAKVQDRTIVLEDRMTIQILKMA